MRKIIKKIAGVLIMATVTTNLTGCIMTKNQMMNQAGELLEQKYDEQFNVLECYGRMNFDGDYEVVAASQEHPDVLFEAKVLKKDLFLSDEYVTSRVCRSMEEQILQNLGDLPGYLFVKVQAISKSIDSDNADITMEEYLKLKDNNRFVVYLHYSPTQKNVQKVYETMESIFCELGKINGTIQLYIVEENILKQVQEHLDELPKIDEAYRDILKDIDRISIPFENGKMQMTEEEFMMEARGRA